jgi:predicted deacylase
VAGRVPDQSSKLPIGQPSPFPIGDTKVEPGTRARLELFVARLPTQTPLNLPVEIVNGSKPGPALWLSAAIHGDELNGVEIIHRVLERVEPTSLEGVLVAVPVVNVFGFIHQERYLPDRRDLNRHFPGSSRGSLASQLAHLFMTEIVERCTHGIDLHTGSLDRINLPQVRCDLENPTTRRCAEAFGAPIMIHGEAPKKSLRQAAAKLGKCVLVYEAGEPQRFNAEAVDIGVEGVLRVMAQLGMLSRPQRQRTSMQASRRTWVRAPRSGILRLRVGLGDWVEKNQTLGTLRDIFGEDATRIRSPAAGLVIGHAGNPLVNRGDAVVHLARNVVG